MACRGVHFALSDQQYEKLCQLESDEDVIDFIQEDIEEQWDKEWLRETDKAWDAMHRCLTDGKLAFANGKPPLNRVILGGRQLHRGDDYIVSLVTPAQVQEIAAAIGDVDRDFMRARYFQIDPNDYDVDLDDEDFEYTWHWFERLSPLYAKAAAAGRAVVFTVDQ
ncbi:DUF1877 family protein [Exilibacterium tricleocarpae]|uniref:DUF1877 family protein n=1 Tax=Exilibacterium tricleocarpae TaxID=2591008 RepID=A0A545SXK5_9GAMM|nr:YfbM family protein [Exilibacterium tricleocarpae]TQV69702.1 DUF1877 family protein [Exilibacterium tricleocarpae]